LHGPLAEEVKRHPQLTLVDTRHPSMFWIEFADQWDPKAMCADQRVHLAMNYALDRQAIREKKLRGLFMPGAGISGNAATCVEASSTRKGALPMVATRYR
jgi:hypothetical protein